MIKFESALRRSDLGRRAAFVCRRPIFTETGVDENADQREEHTAKHACLHAELLGHKTQLFGKRSRRGIGDHRIRDDTHELRADGSAEVAACRHHGVNENAAFGETVGSHDQITGPKHGNAKARARAGKKSERRKIGNRRREIAKGCADRAEEKHLADIFSDLCVERTAQTEHNGKQRYAAKVAPKLGNAERHFQIAGAPLRHRAFCRAAEKNGENAEPNALVAKKLQRARGLLGRFHGRNLTSEEKEGGGQGNERDDQCEPLPSFISHKKQKYRADGNHENDAPRVDRMKLAHFSVGIVGGNGGNDGADQYLGKTACRREDHRSDHKAEINVIGRKERPDRVDQKADDAKQGNGFNRFADVEFVGEKRKDQVNDELCDEIDQHQKTE